MLLAQDNYVQAVAKAHQEACDLNGRKWAKDERLKELLKAPHLRRVPKRSKAGGGGVGGVAEGLLAEITGGGGGSGSVPMPLDPTVQVLQKIYRSIDLNFEVFFLIFDDRSSMVASSRWFLHSYPGLDFRGGGSVACVLYPQVWGLTRPYTPPCVPTRRLTNR